MSSDGAKLVRAASKGDDAKVKRLLRAKVDVNFGGSGHCSTALQQACCKGHVGATQLLLKAKASVDLRDLKGCTALYGASQNGHPENVRLLLEAKATVDLVTIDGCAPLYVACQEGHLECGRLLLEAKAML